MTEACAKLLARVLSGEAWKSGNGGWVVTLHTGGDYLGTPERFVVFTGEAVCEYESEEAFEAGRPPLQRIHLQNENAGDRWNIQDERGRTFYQDPDLELGWTDEHAARREARYLETREGGRYWVREQ
jgi:hypothetical protein